MNQQDKVNAYLNKNQHFLQALEKLRKIMLKAGLEETYKWSFPVYTYQGKNIAGLGAFKNHFGVWFFQGSLLEDKGGYLMNAQEGKTKAMRQWRFENENEIDDKLLTVYLREAIKNEEAGKSIKAEREKKIVIPPYLKSALNQDLELKSAYDELSMGKKRDYAEFIETAKQTATKERRLQKIIPMIKAGIGLNDQYKSK